MKTETIEELKNVMISTYKKFGDDTALLVKGKRSWTGNEIAKEIEEETEFGIDMLGQIIRLSIDLIKRDKINQ